MTLCNLEIVSSLAQDNEMDLNRILPATACSTQSYDGASL